MDLSVFIAPRISSRSPSRMPGTPIRLKLTNTPTHDGESGCQAPPKNAPSGSATGVSARRRPKIESATRCSAAVSAAILELLHSSGIETVQDVILRSRSAATKDLGGGTHHPVNTPHDARQAVFGSHRL